MRVSHDNGRVTLRLPGGVEVVEEPVEQGWKVTQGETKTTTPLPLSWAASADLSEAGVNTSDVLKAERGALMETGVPAYVDEDIQVRYVNLYMKGRTPRGDVVVHMRREGEDPGEYRASDVKISSQNLKAFCGEIKLAEDLDTDAETRILQRLLRLKSRGIERAEHAAAEVEDPPAREDINADPEEVEEILEGSYLIDAITRTDNAHIGDYALKALTVFSALSKPLTGLPINLWSVGTSGSGKTHNYLTMFKTLPREHKVKFDACSPKALYYFARFHGSDCLKDKVVMFNEVEASEEATEVLRSITDPTDEDVGLLTVIDQESVEIRIEGNPVTWFTSVDPLKDDQLKNRFLLSNPDETGDHKHRIAEFQQDRGRRGDLQPAKQADYPALKAAYRRIVEDTRDLRVLIPYAWKWNREENARLQPFFIGLIHLSAKMHYRHRAVLEDHGVIVASLDDYYLAKFTWDLFESLTLEGVKEQDFEILSHVPKDKDKAVTRSDLQETTGLGKWKVVHATNRLMDAGLINGVKEKGVWHYFKLRDRLANVAISLSQASLQPDRVKNFLESELDVCIDPGVLAGCGVTPQWTPHPALWEGVAQTFKDEYTRFLEEKTTGDPCKNDIARFASPKNKENDGKEPDTEHPEEAKKPRVSQEEIVRLTRDYLNPDGRRPEIHEDKVLDHLKAEGVGGERAQATLDHLVEAGDILRRPDLHVTGDTVNHVDNMVRWTE